MPRKNKIIRAAEKLDRAEKQDKLLSNTPPHIAKRLGAPSELLRALATAGPWNWNGLNHDDDGNQISHPPDGKAANKMRENEATSEALRLKEKYGAVFFNRKSTTEIAAAEGVSERTIRRHRERAVKNGQAK